MRKWIVFMVGILFCGSCGMASFAMYEDIDDVDPEACKRAYNLLNCSDSKKMKAVIIEVERNTEFDAELDRILWRQTIKKMAKLLQEPEYARWRSMIRIDVEKDTLCVGSDFMRSYEVLNERRPVLYEVRRPDALTKTNGCC
ncbi:MAG: hypothetical protein LBJ83_00865 [Oscillospiraceae bacterium]|nr:hypothetical protein [Oscillospiraceae bacterium]